MADTELKILITATNQAKDALNQVAQQLTGIQKTVAAGFGADLDQSLGEQLGQIRQKSDEARESLKKHSEEAFNLGEAYSKLVETTEFLFSGWLALKGVGLAQEFGETAARSEVLAIALEEIGTRAGYTAKELKEADEAVIGIGVSAEKSRQALSKMIANQIPLDFAKPFAEMARDLATISGQSTSDTFARIIQAVDSGNTTLLRRMGVFIDRQQVLNKAMADTGRFLDANQQKIVVASAVVEQAAHVQGVYTASLGTAGQLLGDLPEKVEGLKDAIGSVLLPVYTAFLQELSNVVDALKDTVEAMNGGEASAEGYGDSMKRAGDRTNVFASAIRQLGEALVGFIKFIKEIKEPLQLAFDAGKVLLFTKLAFTGFNLVTTAVEGAAAAITAGGAALEGLGVAAAGAEGALAALAPEAAPFLLVAGAIAGALYLFNNLKEAQKGAADATRNDAQAVEEYRASTQRLIETTEASEDAAKKLAKAQEQLLTPEGKSDAVKEQIEAAKKVSDAANAARAEAQKAQQEAGNDLDKRNLSGPLKEAADAVKKIGEDYKQGLADASSANTTFRNELEAAGIGWQTFATGVSKGFSQSANAVTDAMGHIHDEGVDTTAALTALQNELGRLATQVKSSEDFDAYYSALAAFRSKAIEEGRDASIAVEALLRAALDGRNKALADAANGGAVGTELFVKDQKFQEQVLADSLKHEIELIKAAQSERDAADKFGYEQGLLSLDAYYKARAQSIATATAAELATTSQQLGDVQRQLANATRAGLSQDAIRNLEEQQRVLQGRIGAIQAEGNAKQNNLLLEHQRDLVKQVEQVAAISFQNAADTGNPLAAKLAEINLKYEQQKRALHAVGDAAAEAALDQRHALDLAEATVDTALQHLQKQVDLQKSLLDLEGARIALAQTNGQLTDIQAQERKNELLQQQAELVKQQIRAQQAAAEADRQAFGDSSDRYIADQQHIADLQKSYLELQGQIKNVGDTIRTDFQDGLSEALTDSITGAKNWHDAFLGFFNDISKKLVSMVTKDFTQKLFGGDKDGSGLGLFDKLGALITGQKPVGRDSVDLLGSSAGHAMYVQDVTNKEFIETQKQLAQQLAAHAESVTNPKQIEAAVKSVASTVQTNPLVSRQGAAGSIEAFKSQYLGAAQAAGARLGVDPNVLLGQWGLETGWGRSVIPGTNNLGNIKDFSGGGVSARDNQTGSTDKYRVFKSPEDFANAYADMIERKYPKAVGSGSDAGKFASALKAGGYAEDKNYVPKVEKATAQVEKTGNQLQKTGDAAAKATAELNKLKVPGATKETGPALTPEQRQAAQDKAVLKKIVFGDGKDSGSAWEDFKGGVTKLASAAEDIVTLPVNLLHDVGARISNAAFGTNEPARGLTPNYDRDVRKPQLDAAAAAKAAKDATEKHEKATEKNTEAVEKNTEKHEEAKKGPGKGGNLPSLEDIKAGNVGPGALGADSGTPVYTIPVDEAGNTLAKGGGIGGRGPAGTSADPLYVEILNGFSGSGKGRGGAGSGQGGAGESSSAGGTTAKTQTELTPEELAAQSLGSGTKTNPGGATAGFNAGLSTLVDSLPLLGGGLSQIAGKGNGKGALGTWGTILGAILSKSITPGNIQAISSFLGGLFGDTGGDALGGVLGGLGDSAALGFSDAAALGSAGVDAAVGSGIADSAGLFGIMAGLAGGGMVSGPGTGTSDDIAAWLSDGEYVMPAKQTAMFAPMLEAMRSGALDHLAHASPTIPKIAKYASGGMVSSTAGLQHGQRLQPGMGAGVTMIINTPDANSFRQSQDQIANELGQRVNRATRRNS